MQRPPQSAFRKTCARERRPARLRFAVRSSASSSGPTPDTPDEGSSTSSSLQKELPLPEDLPPLLLRPYHEAVWVVAWPAIFIGALHSLYGLLNAYWIGTT
eukprot:3224177-Pyramimonas_sp.AAC.3